MFRAVKRWWARPDILNLQLTPEELVVYETAGVHHLCNQPVSLEVLAPIGATVVFLLVRTVESIGTGISWIAAIALTRAATAYFARQLAGISEVRNAWQRYAHFAANTLSAVSWSSMLLLFSVSDSQRETLALMCVVVSALFGLFSSPGYLVIGVAYAATMWMIAMLWCTQQTASWGWTTAFGFTFVLVTAFQYARQSDLGFRRAILGQVENARLVAELEIARKNAQTANDELVRRNENLDELARRDHLTGLANRRHFLELLERYSGERGRDRWFLTILDADKFKRVNDNYGHPAGDRVLKAIAEAVRAHVRRQDCLARIGGEEFGLILVDIDFTTARAVVERIRAAVGTIDVGVGPISLSAGMFQGGKHVTGELAMIRADAALYNAKRSGRNRLVCDHPNPPSPAQHTIDA
jgi:diguanylate cyclase (GGDEF)-like protein